MTVGKDVSSSVLGLLEVQPRRRLDRRLFSFWSAGRPVCDSTHIGVAYVSHRQLPTASLSPGILVLCYCGSGTQERPDGTQYVLGCAASVDHAAAPTAKSQPIWIKILHTPKLRNTLVGRLRTRSARGRLQAKSKRQAYVFSVIGYL